MRSLIASSFILTASLLLAGNVTAQEIWKARKADASKYPAEIVSNKLAAAPNGLPDGKVFTAESGDIRKAWYEEPTTRYSHGVLGDKIEAGELKIEGPSGRSYSVRLPRNEVFEDITPRIVDLDSDGRNEVVTIRSSLSYGASVTIYGMSNGALVQKASTGFIGNANRWLNIAAIAPMAESGGSLIAFVRTPHIGGDLILAAYYRGAFVQLGGMNGFSNHVIGSNELRLSAIADANGNGNPDLALPSQDRKTLRIVGFKGKALTEIATAELPAPINKAIAVETNNGRPVFVTGLEDGTVWRISAK